MLWRYWYTLIHWKVVSLVETRSLSLICNRIDLFAIEIFDFSRSYKVNIEKAVLTSLYLLNDFPIIGDGISPNAY